MQGILDWQLLSISTVRITLSFFCCFFKLLSQHVILYYFTKNLWVSISFYLSCSVLGTLVQSKASSLSWNLKNSQPLFLILYSLHFLKALLYLFVGIWWIILFYHPYNLAGHLYITISSPSLSTPFQSVFSYRSAVSTLETYLLSF